MLTELGFSLRADPSPQPGICSTSSNRAFANSSLYRATLNFRGILYYLGPLQISDLDHSKPEDDSALQAGGALATTTLLVFCSVKRTPLF